MKLFSRPLGTKVRYIPTADIRPNPNQPRKVFGDEALRSLAASIRENGVLQPLTVRRVEGAWELIAGERRLRAAKLAGLLRVPCVEVSADAEHSSLYALIENLQRRDLDFVEQAEGLRRLIAEFSLSQDEAAKRIGLSQSAVANKLRVLKLEPELLDALRRAGCTERHARALLPIEDAAACRKVAEEVIREGLTVAETEELVRALLAEKPAPKPRAKRKFVLKDVRIFLNTVREAVKMMRLSGVDARAVEEDNEGELVVTIRIPRSDNTRKADIEQQAAESGTK